MERVSGLMPPLGTVLPAGTWKGDVFLPPHLTQLLRQEQMSLLRERESNVLSHSQPISLFSIGKAEAVEDADMENAWFPTPVASVKHI